ncbi:MAG: 2-hydroxyacyl-CoA dehydratase family protein [candidate division WOR-3 bacterium]|nr:2-hydroxyacyl-CoA dehydratase family protein [candidate division WOR-3 bacterium]
MKLIGYACSYIPVEILSATGLQPYRLLHGDIDLSKQGERFVRVDACPMVKSNLAYAIQNADKFAALIGTTGCDMSRRMFDVLSEQTNIPVYMVNNPRTDNPAMYNDEIDWLVKQLEHFSHMKFTDEMIREEISKWEGMRAELRIIDEKRAAHPSLVSTTDFHSVMAGYHKGSFDENVTFCQNPSDRPRLYLLGSAITYEANHILQLIEENLRIVGDFNCGLSRPLHIKIEGQSIDGIKKAYYNQPPCLYKRPHQKYYDFVAMEIARLRCIGIIAWTLDYCDVHEFELQKIEKVFNLPVLRIRSDFSYQGNSQLRTRIEAFAEMLCSRI